MKTVTTIREGYGLGVRRIVEDAGVHYVIAYDPTASLATLPAAVALEIAGAIMDDLGEDLELPVPAIAYPRPAIVRGDEFPTPPPLPISDPERLMRGHFRRQTAIHIAMLAHQLDTPDGMTGQVSAALDLLDEVEEQLTHREAVGEMVAGKRIFSEAELRAAIAKVWKDFRPGEEGWAAAITEGVADGIADRVIKILWGRD